MAEAYSNLKLKENPSRGPPDLKVSPCCPGWHPPKKVSGILQIASLLQHRSLFEKETKVFILANFEVFLKFPTKTGTILASQATKP
eukprot:scaffold4429_cov81-Cyclotella_meneghiniana.AAC.5